MRIILTILSLLIEALAIQRWQSCWLFNDYFYFTPSMITARTINAINLNKDLPPLLTHIMHNKIVYFGWTGIQTLLQYWDVRFLKELVGIVGFFGIMLALWYLFTKFRKNLYLWIVFLSYLILSTLEMFLKPDILYIWKIITVSAFLIPFSLFGIWQFLNVKSYKRYIFIIVLLILSILTLFLFPLTHEYFCLKR